MCKTFCYTYLIITHTQVVIIRSLSPLNTHYLKEILLRGGGYSDIEVVGCPTIVKLAVTVVTEPGLAKL